MYVIFSAYPHLPSRPFPPINRSVLPIVPSGVPLFQVPMAVVCQIFGRTIKRGDLLVTSATEGYVMNGTDPIRMLRAIVSKALGSISCTGDERRHA
jgi:hypothetical protein